MFEVRTEDVRRLQELVNDARVTVAHRSLEVRRFCLDIRRGRTERRTPTIPGSWTNIDADHLMSISSDIPLLANYLVERVVAGS